MYSILVIENVRAVCPLALRHCGACSRVILRRDVLEVEIRLSCSKTDCRAVGVGRVHGCCCASPEPNDRIRYCPYHAVSRHRERILRMFPDAKRAPESFPFFPCQKGKRMVKCAFQATVETTASLLGLQTVGPRGENLYTGHVCRRTGAETFTAAGIEVSVIQIFGRWGSDTVLRYCKEAPLASSSSIAARVKRPSTSELAVDGGEATSIREAVTRLESMIAECKSLQQGECEGSAKRREYGDRVSSMVKAERALKMLGEDSDEEAQGTEKTTKIVNYEYDYDQRTGDRKARYAGDMAGVVHIANVYHPDIPRTLWRTRCGWRFGRKSPHTWSEVGKDDDLFSYEFCGKCIGNREE